MPLVAQGGASAAIVARINKELPALVKKRTTLAKPPAKDSPAGAATRCAGDPLCLSTYGSKARAERVLYGVTRAEGKVTIAELSVMRSADGAEVRHTTVSFSSPNDVRPVLLLNIEDLLSPATARATGEAATEPPAPVEAPALEAIALPPKKKAAEEAPAPEPALEPVPVAPSAEITASPDLGPPDDSIALTPIKPISKRPRPRPLLWTGVTLAAVGAVGLGVGTFFGVSGLMTGGQVTDQTPQTTTATLEQQANTQLLLANVITPIGGGVAAVGLALIIVDIVLDLRGKPSTHVSANGAAAGWEFEW